MKERPILYSGPMVRAILDGTKTQTRRVVKLPHMNPLGTWECATLGGKGGGRTKSGDEVAPFPVLSHTRTGDAVACPYGAPGDRLWVREGWQDVHPLQVAVGRYSKEGRAGIPGPPPVAYRAIYRADGPYPRLHFQSGEQEYPWREVCAGAQCARQHVHPEEAYNGWESPIFMPRWASRLTLEVTNVRVERLQDISEADARAEGAELLSEDGMSGWGHTDETCPASYTRRNGFRHLWDSINAKRAPWDSDPWVWVVSFTAAPRREGADE